MRAWNRGLITSLIAIMIACLIAFVLAAISQLTKSGGVSHPDSGHIAVPSLAYGTVLNDQNIVDYMAGLALDLGIRKVDWREPVLYADFYMRERKLDRASIFNDIRALCQFSLGSMRNVEQVRIRVYDAHRSGARLLLAVTADESGLARLNDERENSPEDGAEHAVRAAFRVQTTVRWANIFGES